jgi:hypothetical protein
MGRGRRARKREMREIQEGKSRGVKYHVLIFSSRNVDGYPASEHLFHDPQARKI